MDSLSAYLMGQSARARGAAQKVFDWDKAAKIIKDRRPKCADAGLDGDYEYTRGCIFRDGQIVTDDYCYLSSNWATPMLILDDDEEMPCFTGESSGFGPDTKWPDSARAILKGD